LVWGLTLSKKLFDSSIFLFNFIIATGAYDFQSPHLRQCKYVGRNSQTLKMKNQSSNKLKDGDRCEVIAGTHSGKSGTVRDIHTSKTGHITITVEQKNGVRFKTLGKSVVVLK